MNRLEAPWQIGNRYGNNRTEILNRTGGLVIATVWTHERRSDGEAPKGIGDYKELPDAKRVVALIATAPEMFAAIKALIRDRATCPMVNGRDLEAWDMMVAAIRKVEAAE